MKNKSQYRKGTLEAKIESFLNEAFPNQNEDTEFKAVAFELWREAEGGWSVNTPFVLRSAATKEELISAARGRWEAFKANYVSNARVSDLSDEGYDETIYLEVNGVSFLEITLA